MRRLAISVRWNEREAGRAAILIVALAVVLLVPVSARAQDANYWSMSYGSIGQLLGGVVIGSVRDLSATYYNPGGLVLNEDPDLLITVDALQAERLHIQTDDPGTELDVTANRASWAPSILAGALPFAGPKSRMAWSYLPRFKTDFIGNENRTFGDAQGELNTEALFIEKLSENWYGGTWSRRFGAGFGIGGTGYLAYRSFRYRREFNAQEDSAGAPGGTALITDNIRYKHYRMLAKIGAAWDRGPMQLGLTITTPSLGLFGNGQIGFTRSVADVDLDGDQTPDNYLARGYDEPDSDYYSSWAIGAGGSYLFRATRLHLTAEWYKGSNTTVLRSDTFSPGEGLGDIQLELDANLDDVFNIGAGIEQPVSEMTSLFAGFTLDQSALAKPYDSRFASAQWDLYHLTVGAATRMRGSRITGGIGYTWGGTDEYDLFDDFFPNNDNIAPVESDLRYSRIMLLVGFEIGGSRATPEGSSTPPEGSNTPPEGTTPTPEAP